MTWRFRVLLNGSLLVAFSQEFIDDLNAEEIKTTIEKWRIVDLMRDHPDKIVLVTTTGPTLEDRE